MASLTFFYKNIDKVILQTMLFVIVLSLFLFLFIWIDRFKFLAAPIGIILGLLLFVFVSRVANKYRNQYKISIINKSILYYASLFLVMNVFILSMRHTQEIDSNLLNFLQIFQIATILISIFGLYIFRSDNKDNPRRVGEDIIKNKN